MIRSRTTQLIYQTIYCTLGLIGTIASIGIFDNVANLRWDFYVHFTNISNFFCLAVMLVALWQTARRKDDGYVTAIPALKFIGMLGILLTFLVFNIMLAGAPGREASILACSAAAFSALRQASSAFSAVQPSLTA